MSTKFLVLVLAIIVVFRILGLANKSLKNTSIFKHHNSYILQLIELTLWLFMLIWLVKHYYLTQNTFGLISVGICFILAIIPSFYLLRDFLSGVYLKSQNQIRVNSFIEINELKGKIDKLGNFSLNLMDRHGNIKSIPYHKINSTIISKQSNNPNLNKVNLRFVFPSHVPTNYIIPKLKAEIINSPWVALSQPIIVEAIKHVNDQYIFEVIIYTLQPHFAEDIKNRVNKSMMSDVEINPV
ncbi:mechanosensitive ion channel domain-containing protein [Ancylomarina sp. 16SWW S1-10-2]|uniref:mechanosensitive ion channel domain-containing protein n=1 Tax=Ancylomarina sp. 16SWW S1-10-2 TaxID=2499681 RepID=UPI0012ADE325|nr:mechanosensitive ion channel domain-containing protein [Ancylomarina sp. 16SWW S1-10-2]MRT93925.1 mechanosensitive ion channel [Ancylomarina sp. 16SWW S1-10-2]